MDLKKFKADSSHLVLSAERIEPYLQPQKLQHPVKPQKQEIAVSDESFKVPVF